MASGDDNSINSFWRRQVGGAKRNGAAKTGNRVGSPKASLDYWEGNFSVRSRASLQKTR